MFWNKLRIANNTITTNAAANTQTGTQLIAAPGAGLRIRVFKVDIVRKPNMTGGIRCLIRDNAGLVWVALGISTTGGADHWWGGENGFTIATNLPLQALHDSNVASQLFDITALYHIEETVV